MSELSSPQNLEKVCAYLELCVEEAKDKAWGDGISFALCFIKKLLPSAQSKPKWISVNDKLPEEGNPVLLLYINEEIGFSESCRPKFWNQLTDNTIVGWFPIPKETKING